MFLRRSKIELFAKYLNTFDATNPLIYKGYV